MRKKRKVKNWRNSSEWRRTKRTTLRRDKCKCVICGETKKLQVHHKQDASYHPDLKFVVDNCVTLCKNCHINLHTNFKNSFREKCTLKDWNNFVVLSKYFLSK